jgi:hypothetical protein
MFGGFIYDFRIYFSALGARIFLLFDVIFSLFYDSIFPIRFHQVKVHGARRKKGKNVARGTKTKRDSSPQTLMGSISR